MQIGIWGDSITYGGPEEGWVGLLRKALVNEYTEVYNRGICGDTTEDILKRFSIEADSIEPETVIFAVGANDSKYPKGQEISKVPLDKYKENIRKLVADARTRVKRVLIIGIAEVDEAVANDRSEHPTRFYNKVIDQYDAFLGEFAKQEGLEYIRMNGVLDPKTDLEDGIHPNTEGYRKMFEAIHKVVK